MGRRSSKTCNACHACTTGAGGAEHAVLHLLYARFWHKVLYDLGVVTTKEPFRRLVSQGMILGEVEYTAFQDQRGDWVPEDHPQASPVR